MNKKMKIAVDTTENVSREDMQKLNQDFLEWKAKLHEIAKDLPDLDEESKRSDRFFGMRLDKSTDDIENTFLGMFAEFVSLMALLIGTLGFGVLLWAIFG